MAFLGTLYPYQEPTVSALISRGNLLLAFGAGLGKTACSLAAAEKLMEEEQVALCLIICPASLKYQWQDKIKEFTNTKVIVVDGDKDTRDNEYDTWHKSAYYLIISYDYVILDEQVAHINPDMVILDEASAIKSFRTQRSKKIKKLFKDTPYRLALTATPIENKPDELFSIMQFTDSSVLGRYDLFDKAYIVRNKNGWVTSYKNLDILHQRLGDAMIRKSRTDPDVRDFMPDVDTLDWTVPMSPEVAKVYASIARDMLTELSKVASSPHTTVDLGKYLRGIDESTPPGRLMAMHMCLEMMLCHPSVVYNSAANYLLDRPEGSEYAYLLSVSEDFCDIPLSSQKLVTLKSKLLEILEDPAAKVLIYSKYKFMLEILRKELPYSSVLFTGDMSAKEKDAAKKKFAEDAEIRLFLSSYAGGYGLDMNMATHLINYDLPWSFGQQDQINNRHVRASSAFYKVYVHNLITENSIEERKQRMLERKRRMSELAVDGASGDSSVALDADFLRTHLTQFLEGYR